MVEFIGNIEDNSDKFVDKYRQSLPLHAEYFDTVSDEDLDRIQKTANNPDLLKAKVTSGPAW